MIAGEPGQKKKKKLSGRHSAASCVHGTALNAAITTHPYLVNLDLVLVTLGPVSFRSKMGEGRSLLERSHLCPAVERLGHRRRRRLTRAGGEAHPHQVAARTQARAHHHASATSPLAAGRGSMTWNGGQIERRLDDPPN